MIPPTAITVTGELPEIAAKIEHAVRANAGLVAEALDGQPLDEDGEEVEG